MKGCWYIACLCVTGLHFNFAGVRQQPINQIYLIVMLKSLDWMTSERWEHTMNDLNHGNRMDVVKCISPRFFYEFVCLGSIQYYYDNLTIKTKCYVERDACPVDRPVRQHHLLSDRCMICTKEDSVDDIHGIWTPLWFQTDRLLCICICRMVLISVNKLGHRWFREWEMSLQTSCAKWRRPLHIGLNMLKLLNTELFCDETLCGFSIIYHLSTLM